MYIALDIGGTKLRISSYAHIGDRQCLQKVTLSAAANQNYGDALMHIIDSIERLAHGETIQGVAISMTGGVDPHQELIRSSNAYPDWANHKLSEDLGQRFSCKHAIENDAICAGLGEKFAGKGGDFPSMGFIIVGTGVGAMRIHSYGGKALVYPTEFGHIPILADGERCVCGQRGCIEAYVSGKGLQAFYDTNAESLADKEAWIIISQRMTQALMNFLTMDYVETFIFGGGVALNQPSFIDKLLKNIEMMLMERVPYEIPLFQKSDLFDDAGSIGSLMLLRNDLEIINMNYR